MESRTGFLAWKLRLEIIATSECWMTAGSFICVARPLMMSVKMTKKDSPTEIRNHTRSEERRVGKEWRSRRATWRRRNGREDRPVGSKCSGRGHALVAR